MSSLQKTRPLFQVLLIFLWSGQGFAQKQLADAAQKSKAEKLDQKIEEGESLDPELAKNSAISQKINSELVTDPLITPTIWDYFAYFTESDTTDFPFDIIDEHIEILEKQMATLTKERELSESHNKLAHFHFLRFKEIFARKLKIFRKEQRDWLQKSRIGTRPYFFINKEKLQLKIALEIQEKAIFKYPNQQVPDFALLNYAELLVLNQAPNAVFFLDKLRENYPYFENLDRADALIAEIYFQQSDFKTAYGLFKRLKESDDNKARLFALNRLAWIYLLQNQNEDKRQESIKYLNDVVLGTKLFEEHFWAQHIKTESLFDLVRIYSKNEDSDDAEAFFNLVKDPELYIFLKERQAFKYLKNKDLRNSARLYEEITELSVVKASLPFTQRKLAKLYLKLKNIPLLFQVLSKMQTHFLPTNSPWVLENGNLAEEVRGITQNLIKTYAHKSFDIAINPNESMANKEASINILRLYLTLKPEGNDAKKVPVEIGNLLEQSRMPDLAAKEYLGVLPSLDTDLQKRLYPKILENFLQAHEAFPQDPKNKIPTDLDQLFFSFASEKLPQNQMAVVEMWKKVIADSCQRFLGIQNFKDAFSCSKNLIKDHYSPDSGRNTVDVLITSIKNANLYSDFLQEAKALKSSIQNDPVTVSKIENFWGESLFLTTEKKDSVIQPTIDQLIEFQAQNSKHVDAPKALNLAFDQLITQKKFKQALAVNETLAKNYLQFAENSIWKSAELLRSLGDFEDAVLLYFVFSEQYQSSSNYLLSLYYGGVLSSMLHFEERGIKAFSTLLEKNPNHPLAQDAALRLVEFKFDKDSRPQLNSLISRNTDADIRWTASAYKRILDDQPLVGILQDAAVQPLSPDRQLDVIQKIDARYKFRILNLHKLISRWSDQTQDTNTIQKELTDMDNDIQIFSGFKNLEHLMSAQIKASDVYEKLAMKSKKSFFDVADLRKKRDALLQNAKKIQQSCVCYLSSVDAEILFSPSQNRLIDAVKVVQ